MVGDDGVDRSVSLFFLLESPLLRLDEQEDPSPLTLTITSRSLTFTEKRSRFESVVTAVRNIYTVEPRSKAPAYK